jgi:hypothetical protein
MKLRWEIMCGLLVMAAGIAGCDVEACSDRDESGACSFDGFRGDAGLDIDAGDAARSSGDSATPGDSAVDGGGAVQVDASSVGQLDGGNVDAAPPPLARAAFCDSQYRTAMQWRDLLEGLGCPCDSAADRDGRAYLVEVVLLFNGVAQCNVQLDRLASNTVYNPGAAATCAAAFDAQFQAPPPPSSCPAIGFDIAALESMIAHGAQSLAQIPACRVAFAGTLARDVACRESMECAGGLRCLPVPGGGTSCQPARSTNAPCAVNSDCADGHVCAGSQATGRTCIQTGALSLRPQGGNCATSTECIQSLVCDLVAGKCVQPSPDVICQP